MGKREMAKFVAGEMALNSMDFDLERSWVMDVARSSKRNSASFSSAFAIMCVYVCA